MIIWDGNPAPANGGRYLLASHDDDGDDICSTFDNCVSVANTDQLDTDGDGWGDLCDICPLSSDPLQADLDGDLTGDARDCAPADPTIFAAPGEVATLGLLGDKTTIRWSSDAPESGDGTVHELLRGATTEFPVGSGPSETCIQSGIQSLSTPCGIMVSIEISEIFI